MNNWVKHYELLPGEAENVRHTLTHHSLVNNSQPSRVLSTILISNLVKKLFIWTSSSSWWLNRSKTQQPAAPPNVWHDGYNLKQQIISPHSLWHFQPIKTSGLIMTHVTASSCDLHIVWLSLCGRKVGGIFMWTNVWKWEVEREGCVRSGDILCKLVPSPHTTNFTGLVHS